MLLDGAITRDPRTGRIGARIGSGSYTRQLAAGLNLPYGPDRGGGVDEKSLEDLIREAIEALYGPDGAGGRGVAWGETEPAARLAQQFALEQLAREQAFQAEQATLEFQRQQEIERQRQEYERQRYLEELKADRQRLFTEMLGKDPVRAALFAMGVGGEILPGGERFAGLEPMAGAAQYAKKAEEGLEELLGGDISIGEAGVTGLPEVYKAAGAFSAGQRPGSRGSVGDIGAARTLLTSGFGVGAVPGRGRPGMSPEEMIRQISSVTPTGVIK